MSVNIFLLTLCIFYYQKYIFFPKTPPKKVKHAKLMYIVCKKQKQQHHKYNFNSFKSYFLLFDLILSPFEIHIGLIIPMLLYHYLCQTGVLSYRKKNVTHII